MSPGKIKLITVLLFLIAVALTACVEPEILEYEYLLLPVNLGPRVEEFQVNGSMYLKISGHCGHSALAVDKTISEKKIDGLHVYTYLVLAREGKRSGALEYRVAVPDDVRRVFFGKKAKLIWERKL